MEKVKIKSIKKISIRDRYDLTMPITHNFFANGILIHNTSAIFAHVLCRKKLTFFEKVKKIFGVKVNELEYGDIFSSRSVIKNRYINPNCGSFYSVDVWGWADDVIKPYLDDGMTIYSYINNAISYNYD